MLTGVDRLLGEVEDGVLQGRIEGERLKLLEALGNVGEVSSGPDSQSAKISRRLQFSERDRDRDLSREMRGRSYPRGTIGAVLGVV